MKPSRSFLMAATPIVLYFGAMQYDMNVSAPGQFSVLGNVIINFDPMAPGRDSSESGFYARKVTEHWINHVPGFLDSLQVQVNAGKTLHIETMKAFNRVAHEKAEAIVQRAAQ